MHLKFLAVLPFKLAGNNLKSYFGLTGTPELAGGSHLCRDLIQHNAKKPTRTVTPTIPAMNASIAHAESVR